MLHADCNSSIKTPMHQTSIKTACMKFNHQKFMQSKHCDKSIKTLPTIIPQIILKI